MKSAIITLLAASTQAADVPCTFTTGAECTTAKEACLQMVTESFDPKTGYKDSAPKNIGGPDGPLAACRNVSECNSIENDNQGDFEAKKTTCSGTNAPAAPAKRSGFTITNFEYAKGKTAGQPCSFKHGDEACVADHKCAYPLPQDKDPNLSADQIAQFTLKLQDYRTCINKDVCDTVVEKGGKKIKLKMMCGKVPAPAGTGDTKAGAKGAAIGSGCAIATADTGCAEGAQCSYAVVTGGTAAENTALKLVQTCVAVAGCGKVADGKNAAGTAAKVTTTCSATTVAASLASVLAVAMTCL